MFSREIDIRKVMVFIEYVITISVLILLYLLIKRIYKSGKSFCSCCRIPCFFYYCQSQDEIDNSRDVLIFGSNGEIISPQRNGIVIGLAGYLRSNYSSSNRNVISESPAHDVPPKYEDVCKYDIETGNLESNNFPEVATGVCGNIDTEEMPPPSYEDCYRTIDLNNYCTVKSCNEDIP